MESLLQGIPSVVVHLDDILITGSTEELHLETLGEVLRRNQEAGLELRREKVCFVASSVVYLGVQNRCTRVASHARESESSNGCISANNSYRAEV